jgi:uncharacterized protein
MPLQSAIELAPQGAEPLAEPEALLDALRLRLKAAPSWEFCDGFLAALVCCRRQIEPDECLPVLLCPEAAPLPLAAIFEQHAEQHAFLALWTQRWSDVAQALDTPVTALDDPRAYQPEVVDARAASTVLHQAPDPALPSFGQAWARGFMAAVQAWPEEWRGPRNQAALHWRGATLGLLQALTLADLDPPTLSAFADGAAAPTVSARRMKAFADAIWAVYSLRATWRKLGPRVQTVRGAATPGRNEPCHCGNGKKFKKCCGLCSVCRLLD